jgi:SAM-dependent methyltransferase
VIRRLVGDAPRQNLLEIGCGTGIHLLALAGEFEQAVGTDLSPEMVRVASERLVHSPWPNKVSVRVDPADELATVADRSVDVVLCIGALEHMLERAAVVRQVRRVLRPGGVFVCLTPNGGYWWYRFLAPLVRRDTRHLSTDRFLTLGDVRGFVEDAGLTVETVEHWTFVPRGDLPTGVGPLLGAADKIGERLGIGWLRGGIAVAALRPADAADVGVSR